LESQNIKRKRKKVEVAPEIEMMMTICLKPFMLSKILSKMKNKKRSIKSMKCITLLLKMRVMKIKTTKN
jgi:hypothetical protein